MDAQHTNGPWKICGKEKLIIVSDSGDVIARIAEYGEQSETPNAHTMNALLIASAPELLDALRKADEFITNGIALGYIRMPNKDTPDPAHETPRIVRAAIANAKGE